MELHELRWLLSEFGSWTETRPRKLPSLEVWLKRHKTGTFVLFLASNPFVNAAHAVAVVEGVVSDPSANPNWPVQVYFRKS